jgi:hypothetical protein
MRTATTTFLLSLLTAVAGCGGDAKYVPVSGRVMMDGKPLPNAAVAFIPLGSDGREPAGYGSVGVTDAEGRYTLRVNSQQLQTDGALVGKHRVQITTGVSESLAREYTGPTEDGGPPPKFPKDYRRVPERYNDKSELTFEVPPGGTDKADFLDLKSDPWPPGRKGR